MDIPLTRLVSISRPRFWLYEVGTYAVGVAAALTVAPSPTTLLLLVAFFFYFLFPANLFIYGINDIYDYETDRLNPKKVAYETLVMPDEHRVLWMRISIVTLPALILIPFAGLVAALWFLLFLLCAWQYSAPPIRAKARPVFDSVFSAGHYVATGAFGFVLAGGGTPSLMLLLAGMAWATAMHAYSAVPDIEADTTSGIATIATKLGRTGTLILCLGLYASAGILGTYALGWLSLLLGVVYVGMMVWSLRVQSDEALFRLYARFPLVNTVCGMVVFFATVWGT
jgi:lycopene elongase/hydratase (dihydrobisanhydrobacterioruberin-forming)